MADLLLRKQSPVVTELLLKIIQHVLTHYRKQLEPLKEYGQIN